MEWSHAPQTRLFATSAAGSGWWLLDQLARHGPDWQLVPPLLIGSASLIGAARGWCDAAQARRHAEERHRAELAALVSNATQRCAHDLG